MHSPDAPETTRPSRGGVQWRNLDWKVISAILALHVIALAAVVPVLFSWSGLILMVVLLWASGGLGITLCYHRLLTHRSYKTPRWMEYLLTVIGCLAWQGGPIQWVGTHRLHHKHSDGDHDPHTPRHGFTWAHILWTLHRELEGIRPEEAAKDLARDPVMVAINRWFFLPQFVLTAGLVAAGWAIGGWELAASWVVWGVALRTVLMFHGTWFVNSAAHTWGYRNYKNTGEHSTNLWWVALIGFGEGWHNNHHAHPRSAAHGLRWFEVDITWWLIRALRMVGLAWDIKLPRPEQMPGATR
jgi:fatty-acid desaturase